MDKTWIFLCCLTVIPLVLFATVGYHNPPTVQAQQELLLKESVTMQDQLRTQEGLNVMLSETVGITDTVVLTKP